MKKGTAIIGMIVTFLGGYFLRGQFQAPGSEEGAATPEALQAAGGDVERLRIPVGLSPFKGARDAKVTIVEFSDFQWPFCGRVGPTLKDLEKEFAGQLKIVFKHNPLPMHTDAPLASEASMAAHEQGKFWEYHDKLFENTRAIKREDLDKHAVALGLDAAKFKTALDTNKFKRLVEADTRLGSTVGVKGTPHFFINGRPLSGAQPKEKFAAIIKEEIAAADKLIASGTPVARVYTELMRNAKASPTAAAPGAPGQPPGAQGARPGMPDPSAVYKVPLGESPRKGGKLAKVTIVEFSDFQWPFCGRVGPTLKQIEETYKDQVQIVFKHNPLPFHPNAKPAALASLAAHRQGKFWEYHDKLFQDTKNLTPETFDRYATELGLNVAKFKKDMADPVLAKQVDAEQALSNQLGARGTPAFFINGKNMRGAQPFEAFKAKIDEEMKKADEMLKKGVAAGKLYDEIIKTGLEKVAAAAPGAPGAAGAPAGNTRFKAEVGNSPFKGAKNAKVTILEWSEFQWPFCSRVGPTLKQIEETYKGQVKIVFKHQPLSFHPHAMPAALAAEAAHRQGKFWEMHDKLFADQKALGPATYEKYAQEIGLNMAKWQADMASESVKKAVEAESAAGTKIGARGTPAFFINGKSLSGAQPFESFKAVIDAEIQAADALLKKGVAPAKLYDEIQKDASPGMQMPAPRTDATGAPIKQGGWRS